VDLVFWLGFSDLDGFGFFQVRIQGFSIGSGFQELGFSGFGFSFRDLDGFGFFRFWIQGLTF
jgi:hypothetical protein